MANPHSLRKLSSLSSCIKTNLQRYHCSTITSNHSLHSTIYTKIPSSGSSSFSPLSLASTSKSYHTTTSLSGIFDSIEKKKAANEERSLKYYMDKFTEMMLKEKFTLYDYEQFLKMSAGESGEEAGFFERMKMSLNRKLQKAQGEETPENLKQILEIAKAFKDEEKKDMKLIDNEVLTRVSETTKKSVSEIRFFLDQFDHHKVMSDWYKQRNAQGGELPDNYAQMSVINNTINRI